LVKTTAFRAENDSPLITLASVSSSNIDCTNRLGILEKKAWNIFNPSVLSLINSKTSLLPLKRASVVFPGPKGINYRGQIILIE